MLNRCFTVPFTLQRLANGPSGPFLDGYAAALLAESYALDGCRRHVRTAAELGEWCARRDIALANLNDEVLARFVRWHRGGRKGYDRAPFQAQRFLRFLRESGATSSRAPTPKLPPAVIGLAGWMRQRGLAESTISRTARVAQAFLDDLGDSPQRWDASGVRRFVFGYVRQHAPSSAGLVTTSTRCFLRYLVARGRCATELIDSVPKVPTWRMARLPRYLVKEDVERILASCDGQGGTGLRDRALLLLLARLGLRAHEVVGLRLDDIDWRAGRLRVLGKGRREARLPLPQDAGDAILAYMKKERPAAPADRIFLTSRAPIGPLSTAGLKDVVARAIARSGVQTSLRGTHVLRHSLATRLLREGVALDTIGAVLRHSSVETTAIYAKVDVNLLRQVAQPWPVEVSPC